MPLGIARHIITHGSTYTPSLNIPNLSLWLDPSDTSTTTYNGSNELTAITDKTGTATITVNNTPQKSNLNGLEVLVFNQPDNEYLQSDTTAQVVSGNHWALFMGQIASPDNNKDSIWSFETNQSPKRDYAVSSGDASDFDGELDLDGLSSNRISSNAGNLISFTAQTPIAAATIVIVVAFFNKTGSQIGVRVNGVNAFTPETDYDNNIQNNQQLRIFRNRGSQTFGGTLIEFMSVKGLPGTGGTDMTYIEEAEGYVAHKFNQASLLPVSHPYKSSAP
tara:strand:- start:1015 stop:1845 length:831 start_codon:yes stop_codon:yes gene_type:complete